jgi:hypothetical protein
MKAIAPAYYLNVKKFTGRKLRRGFKTARQALRDGGAIVMLADDGKLTGSGHFIMGYRYDEDGDTVAVSDSNRKNPDTSYPVSWLLNTAGGHVIKLWVYT